MEQIDTVIVGGGQAGMATSYWLTEAGIPHIVLEQAAQPAPVWRNHRWDSFTLVTPNWANRLPGAPYDGDAPNDFRLRDEYVAFLDDYATRFRLPIRCNTTVTAITPRDDGGYLVETNDGPIEARTVVVATGMFQMPKMPECAASIAPHITQLHTHDYRNQQSLPPGAVLVVGSAMSGCQIAEELYQAGRRVYLSTGGTGRVPRRYRGKDIIWWLETIGFFDLTIDQFPPGSSRFDSIPHITGANGGHTLNLHQFARDGVTLLGRLEDIDGTTVSIAPNLHENLAMADGFERNITQMIDDYIMGHGLDVEAEELPTLRDGFDQSIVERLDLDESGIESVIWATGYRFDYSLVNLPVRDEEGYPIQDRGVAEYPGLYFAGMPWMPSERSGFLIGLSEATRHIVSRIVAAHAVTA